MTPAELRAVLKADGDDLSRPEDFCEGDEWFVHDPMFWLLLDGSTDGTGEGQNASNLLETEEEALAQLPALAEVLGVDVDRLSVVQFVETTAGWRPA